MPATTVPFGLPYPLPADPTRVELDVQRLAEAADTQMVTLLANATAAGMPHSAVVQGGPQPVDNNTITDMKLNDEIWDNANYVDLVANPYIITLEPSGIYMVQGTVAFAPNATGFRRCQLLDGNGAVVASREVQAISDPGTGVTIQVSEMFSPNFFSSLRVQARHTAGTTLQVLACEIAAVRIG